MLAPAFRAAGAVVYGGATNVTTPQTLTPVLPTRQNGDLLLCYAWSSSNAMTVTTPTGWTLLTGFPIASGTAVGGKLYVFARIVDGSETGPSVAFASLTTGTSGTAPASCVCSYSNVDVSRGAGSVLDGSATSSDQTGSTTTVTIPSVTTTVQNSLVIGFALKLAELSATFTPPATWSEEVDTLTTQGTGFQAEISDKLFAAAGATGSVTCAPSVTTSSRALGIAFALRRKAPKIQSAVSFQDPGMA